jgi:aspartate-semialdehyde dehydrogenase
MTNKIPVAVLGATGAVGQRFIQLLQNHPVFEVVALTASDRSEGKPYADAVHWVIEGDAPAAVRDMVLLPTQASIVGTRADIRVAFSALPNDSAQTAEPDFARAGVTLFSNASCYRMAQDVPLVITEVNAAHLQLLKYQRTARGWSGGIICNTNCTVSGPAMSLRPLYDAFGVKRVFSVSMQAESGAGYPGVSSLDITDNVLPFIKGEEEKQQAETRKLLGTLQKDATRIEDAPLAVSAHCNRVAVIDGHMVTMSVELASPASPEEVVRVLNAYRCADVDGLPMAPDQPVVVRCEPDRPQPRRDRMTGKGMSTVVGRVRPEPLFGDCGVKYMTLSHNTIRGAAGGSLLNAELAARWGLIA